MSKLYPDGVPVEYNVPHHQPNNFRAPCYRCGGMVPAGEGIYHWITTFEKMAWSSHYDGLRGSPSVTQHNSCHEKYGDDYTHHLYQPDPDLNDSRKADRRAQNQSII